jgi:hypothetical protein
MARARRHDERVVRGRAFLAAAAAAEQHGALLEVEARHLAEYNAGVALVLEDSAQRRGDLHCRERARRDPVEQRLKQVEVAAVNQGHLDSCAA